MNLSQNGDKDLLNNSQQISSQEEQGSFRLRVATAEDQEQVVDVIHRVYDEYGFPWDAADYHADLYDLNAYYFDLGDLFWVAEVEGRVVGTGAIEFFEPVEGEHGTLVQQEDLLRIAGADCALNRLYLLPEFRGRGIGKALTHLALDTARERSCRFMEIWTDKRLVLAHPLYLSLGAVVVGERLCNDPEHAPEWGMLLDIRVPSSGSQG